MSAVGFEIALVLVLLLINGVFAMSEIAVVSARKTRLQQRAEGGDAGAARALRLAEHPTRFLSTVQIGITLVGIFAGAFGGATIAGHLDSYLSEFEPLESWSGPLSLALVVLAITYLSLVLGELVPKRVGLNNPEGIAARVAGPMHLLSRTSAPIVAVLTASTEAVLRLLRIRPSNEPPVTEEEINLLIDQGTEAGIFEVQEHDLVERVFWLGDQSVAALMTPRRRIVWIDLDDPLDEQIERVLETPHNWFVVCEDALDHVAGIVSARNLWALRLSGETGDLRSLLREPLFVPEGARVLAVLERLRDAGTPMALVVDEHGGIEGLVTLNGILEEFAGEITTIGASGASATRRDDGSWLVDASLSIDEVRQTVGFDERIERAEVDYHTLGGFVLAGMGRIPAVADHFTAAGFRFEVVDMDGHRVDKVLVSPLGEEESPGGDSAAA